MEGLKLAFIALVFGARLCNCAPVPSQNHEVSLSSAIYVSPIPNELQVLEGIEQSPKLVHTPVRSKNDEFLPYFTLAPYIGDFRQPSLAPQPVQFSPYLSSNPERSVESSPGYPELVRSFEPGFAGQVEQSLVNPTILASTDVMPFTSIEEQEDFSVEGLDENRSRQVRSAVEGENHPGHEDEEAAEAGHDHHYHLGYGVQDWHHHPHDSYLCGPEEDSGADENIKVERVDEGKTRRTRSVEEDGEYIEPADAEGRHRIRQHSSSNYALSNSFGGAYQGGFGYQNQYGGHRVYDNFVHSHAQSHTDILGGDHRQLGYGGGNTYAVGQGGYPVGYGLNPLDYGQAGYAQSSAYAQSGYGQAAYGKSEYYGGNAYGGYRPGHASSSSAYVSSQANVH